jgi:hypothetical protein
MKKAIWIGLRICSTTLLDAVQWQCNTILNEQKPIQNNPSPSIEGLGPLPSIPGNYTHSSLKMLNPSILCGI